MDTFESGTSVYVDDKLHKIRGWAKVINQTGARVSVVKDGKVDAFHVSDLTSRDELISGWVQHEVEEMKLQHARRWRDFPHSYWFARLVQEIGELGSVLVGDHEDTLVHELKQVASISLNWLEKLREEEFDKDGGS